MPLRKLSQAVHQTQRSRGYGNAIAIMDRTPSNVRIGSNYEHTEALRTKALRHRSPLALLGSAHRQDPARGGLLRLALFLGPWPSLPSAFARAKGRLRACELNTA